MWKRFNREKDRTIGNPVLLDTTYDEKTLDQIPHVNHVNASGATPRGVIGNIAPPDANRISTAPTVSSVYSQPSPDFRDNWRESTTSSHYTTQPETIPSVSPVDDDSHAFPRSSADSDVSPVDAASGTSPYGDRIRSQPPSQIPQPRKAPPKLDGSKQEVERFWRRPTDGKVKWDVYSGEPTTSEKGREGSVKPAAFVQSLRSTGIRLDGMGNRLSSKRESDTRKLALADRPSRTGAKGGLSIETKPRPEWKGASGRMPRIQPVNDQPTKQAFSVPRKARQTLSPVFSDDSGQATPTSATARIVTPEAEALPVSTFPEETDKDDENEIKPTVPLKAGLNSPTAAARPVGHPYPSPTTPGDRYEAPTTTVPNDSSNLHSTSTPQDIEQSAAPRASVDTATSSRRPKEEAQVDSRFSWTTYATNTTYQHSPPPSPPPPVPTVVATPTPAPIVNRRRPLPNARDSPMASTTRKAVARPTSPTFTVRTTASTATNKALPRPPPEMESEDHISNLQAQMDDLGVRRNNIKRLIRDFTVLQASNPMTTDYVTLREYTRQLNEFEDELAEISNLEHDVGMRLHRAYKRRDKDSPEEASTLWIKRITS